LGSFKYAIRIVFRMNEVNLNGLDMRKEKESNKEVETVGCREREREREREWWLGIALWCE